MVLVRDYVVRSRENTAASKGVSFITTTIKRMWCGATADKSETATRFVRFRDFRSHERKESL